MTGTVHLHIGTPKSGTTYLQAALEENRERLAEDGVHFPAIAQQIVAAQKLLRRDGSSDGGEALAKLVRSYAGGQAIVSMESLCTALAPQVHAAAAALDGLDVRVVVTVRDLARAVPAQWQESTQFRHTWTYRDYLKQIRSRGPRRDSPARRSFWSQHDLARILVTWVPVVGADHFTVVTVPRQPGSPDLLWHRFCETVGIDAERYALPESRNESLGATSAELMRRVNLAVAALDSPPNRQEYARAFRQLLAKQVLANRSGREPSLTLPASMRSWASRQADRIIAAVRESGVRVVGDLGDLRPSPPPSTGMGADPSRLPDADVLDAAVEALTVLSTDLAEDRHRRWRRRQREREQE